MENNKWYEKAEDYAMGRLSPDEREAMKKAMENDPALAKEVHLEELVRDAVELQAEKKALADVRRWREKIEAPPSRPWFRQYWWALLGGAALLGLIVFMFWLREPQVVQPPLENSEVPVAENESKEKKADSPAVVEDRPNQASADQQEKKRTDSRKQQPVEQQPMYITDLGKAANSVQFNMRSGDGNNTEYDFSKIQDDQEALRILTELRAQNPDKLHLLTLEVYYLLKTGKESQARTEIKNFPINEYDLYTTEYLKLLDMLTRPTDKEAILEQINKFDELKKTHPHPDHPSYLSKFLRELEQNITSH